jgi:hypothetical protein
MASATAGILAVLAFMLKHHPLLADKKEYSSLTIDGKMVMID